VIRRIRALAQKTDPQQAWLDLNDIIHEVLALVYSEVLTQRVVAPDGTLCALPPVRGDRIQLQQVIMNLVINGIEAMHAVTDQPAGVTDFRSQRHDADNVLVACKTLASWLDPQNMARLFDAFFTTKPSGMAWDSRSAVDHRGARRAAVGWLPTRAGGDLSNSICHCTSARQS